MNENIKLDLILIASITFSVIVLLGYSQITQNDFREKSYNENFIKSSIAECPQLHSNCAEIQLEKKINYLIELMEKQK
jgi:hypothetical protein